MEKVSFKKEKEMGTDRGSVTFFFKESNFQGFEAYSLIHGVAKYFGEEITCRSWENEEIVHDRNKLNKHYSGSFLNGEGDKLLAKEIIDDALTCIGLPELTVLVLNVIKGQPAIRKDVDELNRHYSSLNPS